MGRSLVETTELGRQMAHALPGREWHKVQGLFEVLGRGPFVFGAVEAYRYSEVFRAAAAHPKMSRQSAAVAAGVVAEISAALRSDKSWRWSR